MASLENQMAVATNTNNITGVIAVSNAMNALANKLVLFIWTIYPVQAWTNSAVAAITSNVGGWYYNPGLNGAYFATFYIKS